MIALSPKAESTITLLQKLAKRPISYQKTTIFRKKLNEWNRRYVALGLHEAPRRVGDESASALYNSRRIQPTLPADNRLGAVLDP